MDLTSKFRQICVLVEEEYGIKKVGPYNDNGLIRKEERDFNVKFIADCYKFNQLILEFKEEISTLRGEYLLLDQGNEDEKEFIDRQTLIYVGKLNKMLEALDKTNAEKTKLTEEKLNKKFSIQSSTMKLYLTTYVELRRNVLKYILDNFKQSTDMLAEMKQIRLNRKKQLRSLSSYAQTDYIPIYEEEEEKRETLQEEQPIPDQQLELLQKENQELQLLNKNDELMKISQLEESAMEVLQLQNQILVHLKEQESNITRIGENAETVTFEMALSNKQLRKTNASLNDRGNYLLYLFVFMGVFVLLLDYIKP